MRVDAFNVSLTQFSLNTKSPHLLSLVSSSHFTFLSWCRVSLINVQEYTAEVKTLSTSSSCTPGCVFSCPAYIVLTATVKSQQFPAEPLLFFSGTLIPEAALCGHLDGRNRTIRTLKQTNKWFTIQTCSISFLLEIIPPYQHIGAHTRSQINQTKREVPMESMRY